MQIFARITKVDEATGKVYGRAVQEVVDRSGEIFDYATSKPNFEKWSTDIAKATDGKSVGNVRAMHGKVAVGKLTEITFNDAEKAIDVVAEIVDPVEREKALKGVYTGFSIGGRYVRKWADDVHKGVERYTAEPSEISIVDLPCVPTAQFTVVKSDGSEELRKFEKVAERADVSPKAGEDKYGDVKFADETNHKYPIDTPAHIRAAWNYINKPKNAAKYDAKDLRAIKSKIVAAWKDKIDANGPPSAAKDGAEKADALAVADSRAAGLLAKIDAAEPLLRTVRAAMGQPALEKGLYDVAQLAQLVSSLSCIAECAAAEAAWEGDHSAIPDELRGVVKELAGILIDMADEEVEELVAAYEKADADGDLAKVAASEEDAMNAELQKAHDEAKAELAKVVAERDEKVEALTKAADDLAKAQEALEKATAEREDALKKVAELEKEREKWLNQPAPAKGAARAVEKSLGMADGEAQDDDAPVMKADGTVDHLATAQKLMKVAYRRPITAR